MRILRDGVGNRATCQEAECFAGTNRSWKSTSLQNKMLTVVMDHLEESAIDVSK